MNFLKEIIYQQSPEVLLSPFYAYVEFYNVTDKPHQFFIYVLSSVVFFSLTLLGICFWPNIKKFKTFKVNYLRWFTPIESLLTIIVACALLFYFFPLIFGDVRLLNDNFLLGGQTKLKSGTVQNIEFLRAHRIDGFKLSQAAQGAAIGSKRERIFQVSILSEVPELLPWIGKHGNKQLHFDPPSHVLSFLDSVTPEMYFKLEALFRDKRDVLNLKRKYYEYITPLPSMETPGEVEFEEKNRLEHKWKVLNRWALHHHGFVFNPINEFRLGKPISAISFQYGLLNTLGFYGLTRLLGGFNLQNYLRVSFAFYPLYISALAFVGWLIFRQKQYVYLLFILTVASVLFLDFEKILRAPGINPIRHFFDVFVLGFMVLYWQTRKVKFLGWAYFFVFLQVICNREFGLFLLAATFLAQVLDSKEAGIKTQKKQFVYSGILLLAILVSLYYLKDISNYMNGYYARGFVSPMFKSSTLNGWLIYFGILYTSILFIPSHGTAHLKKTLLFLIVYSNGLFFYYLWGNTKNHLLVISPVYALLILVLAKTIYLSFGEKVGGIDFVRIWGGDSLERKGLFLLICGCFIGFFCQALPKFIKVKNEFDDNFKNHQVHQWNFKRATLKSTIAPLQLQQAVNLIHRYSPDSSAIYIISTLDNILPMLSDRYSAMPFYDLAFYLLTPKESLMAVGTINRNKPKYLFVEHGILNDRSGEISNLQKQESINRILRLDVFTEVFKAVSKDYRKVSTSELIDVYERLADV